MKEGMGTFKFANGNVMRCPWVDGKAHGRGQIIFKGKALSPDVYGYYLRLRCLNEEEYFKKGNITLIR